MATIIKKPINGPLPGRGMKLTESYQRQNRLIDAGHVGYLNADIVYENNVWKIRNGSCFDFNGVMVVVTDDEIHNISALADGEIYIYAFPVTDEIFRFTALAIKPTWDTAKCGWYMRHNNIVHRALVKGTKTGNQIINQVRMDNNLLTAPWPLHAIFMSMDSRNPSLALGGTWTRWGHGRVPVGVGFSDRNFLQGETGGASTHKLTIAEMPEHQHTFLYINTGAGGGTGNYRSRDGGWRPTSEAGEDQPHNNLQPFQTCYMWQKTSNLSGTSSFITVKDDVITGIHCGSLDADFECTEYRGHEKVTVTDTDAIRTGDKIPFYTTNWKRKSDVQLINEGLMPLPVGFVIENGNLRAMSKVEKINAGLAMVPSGYKIEGDELVPIAEEPIENAPKSIVELDAWLNELQNSIAVAQEALDILKAK